MIGYEQLLQRFITAGKAVRQGDCVRWAGALTDGLPRLKFGGRTVMVRRLLWEAKNGPMPHGSYAHCCCDTELCITHTELRTFKALAEVRWNNPEENPMPRRKNGAAPTIFPNAFPIPKPVEFAQPVTFCATIDPHLHPYTGPRFAVRAGGEDHKQFKSRGF